MAPLVAVLGSNTNQTNGELVSAWCGLGIDAELVSPHEAYLRLGPDDIAIGRLDILPGLDGVEAGLMDLLWLERAGVRVLNCASALLAAHDKLLTARVLGVAGLPHPVTTHLPPTEEESPLEPPLVLKPRYGSWGRDVYRCDTAADVERCLRRVRGLPWFRRHGAIVQELVPPPDHDLRLLVAGGRVVGAVERVPAPGEWRTNVSLGGSLRRAVPPPEACELAIAAAQALASDFVGVDLLPLEGGGWVVLELNGAVDFRPEYSLGGTDVYAEVAAALGIRAPRPLLRSTA